MSFPQDQTFDGDQSVSEPSSNTPRSVADLPPEALALAGRLFDYARQGQTDALRQYVSAGIPPNLTNHKGDTLLMLAAYHGHVATVEALLALGADANALNDRGQSPVAGAVFKGYDDVVAALVHHGVDLSAGQPNAIDAARLFRREQCLRLFGISDETNGSSSNGA